MTTAAHCLVILGRDPSDHTVWVDVDGDTIALHPADLADMRAEIIRSPLTRIAGHAFDESDVNQLIHAMRNGPDLDSCRHCDLPGPYVIEGDPMCAGHAAGYGAAEDESMEAAR